MPCSAKPLLLALGYANADIIARVPALPGDGDRVTAEEIATYPGGMAANCSCAAALHGSRVVYFGNLGRDPLGELLLEDFRRYKVDTSHATRVERTTMAIIPVTPQGERAIISEPTAYQPDALATYLREHPEPEAILYLDGYHLVCAQAEVQLARAKGYTIYCDLDGAPDTYAPSEILRVLPSVDLAQWNPKVAGAIFPEKTVEDADIHLAGLVPTVISTRGAESLHLLHLGRRTIVAVPDTGEAVDTTGAGDIFAGVFLHTYAQQKDIERAAQTAVEVAAKSTRYRGARLPFGIL